MKLSGLPETPWSSSRSQCHMASSVAWLLCVGSSADKDWKRASEEPELRTLGFLFGVCIPRFKETSSDQ